MGLFNLFGGKKKDEAKAPSPVKAPSPAKAPASRKAASAKLEAKSAGSVEAPLTRLAAGSVQVKLRLKLAHSLRAGETMVAYEAAKSLAEIQAKAGRRTGARIWREQAERIKAQGPAQAA